MFFHICDIGGGAIHTSVSLNSDWPSIREFTIHLTTTFRYKVTDNINISGMTSKMFLSHVKTKNELTNYLAEKAIVNLKNVNGGYPVSYATKCISNLEDFAQEMMTHDHEEKQTRCYYYTQLMYQQETLSQSFTYTPLILMYFFLLFTSIQYFVLIQHSRLVAANGQERYQ